ncbi:hypothetical protein [Cupriavidus pinatubonensis]|nr:hypothetical protein [Cupriavidus pinatubonensis]
MFDALRAADDGYRHPCNSVGLVDPKAAGLGAENKLPRNAGQR